MIKIINSFFSSNKENNGLKLRFSKKEKTWRVTRGFDILYMGEEQQCENYISNMSEVS